MNTDYFKYLLTVADCRSIRQAAELLHMKQQNLSTIIKNMEKYYGITIFERSHKGVMPTADGQFFLNEARSLLGTLNRLESLYLYPSKRCYSGIVDSLNIYCSSLISSHGLVNVLKEYRAHFPYVNVNLLARSREDIFKAQAEEPQSLSLFFSAYTSAEQFSALPASVVVEPLAKMPVYAATAKDNSSAQDRESISVQELLPKKLVVLSQDQTDSTFVHELLSPYGVPDIQYVVNNTAIYLDLLQHNDLWSVCIANRVPKDALQLIAFEEALELNVYLLYHQEAKENFAMLSLLQLLSTKLLTSANTTLSPF